MTARYKFRVLFSFLLIVLFSEITYSYTVILKSGKQISGDLISEDGETIRIKDSQGLELNFKKEKLDMAKMSFLEENKNSKKANKDAEKKIALTEFKWPDSQIKSEKKDDLSKIVKLNRKTLSKEEIESLNQKLKELSQSADYKEKVRVTNEELSKEQKEAEKKAAELSKEEKEKQRAYFEEIKKKYDDLSKREADLRILCAGNTTNTEGAAVTEIRTDKGDTAQAVTAYGSNGTTRNLEACSQLMQVQVELGALSEKMRRIYDDVVRWGQPLPTN